MGRAGGACHDGMYPSCLHGVDGADNVLQVAKGGMMTKDPVEPS